VRQHAVSLQDRQEAGTMSPTEQGRHELFLALERALGTEPARTLMEQLPPRRWDDLATRDDLAAIDARFEQVDARFEQVDARFEQVDARFEQVDARFQQVDARFDHVEERLTSIEHHLIRIDERFVSLEHRLLAEFRGEFVAHSRLMFFSMVGAIFTAASLAFAAVRF
jgi:predicted nuclease with TOPRIM domain